MTLARLISLKRDRKVLIISLKKKLKITLQQIEMLYLMQGLTWCKTKASLSSAAYNNVCTNKAQPFLSLLIFLSFHIVTWYIPLSCSSKVNVFSRLVLSRTGVPEQVKWRQVGHCGAQVFLSLSYSSHSRLLLLDFSFWQVSMATTH